MIRGPALVTQRWRNVAQTALLLGGMTLLLAAVGWGLAGPQGLALMAGAGIGLMLFGPNLSGRMVMRAVGANRLSGSEAPILFRLLAVLCRRAGLAVMPDLYYLPHAMPQAFTVGDRDGAAAICLSDGILRLLSARQVAGVLAHEVSHILHRDLRVMVLADMVTRLTRTMALAGLLLALFNLPLLAIGAGHFSWWLLGLLVTAPTISMLLQLALSRTREFEADRGAVELTGDGEGLASALATLEARHRGLWERLFRPGTDRLEPSLLRGHPPSEARIARIRQVAADVAPLFDVPSTARPLGPVPGLDPDPRPPPVLRWWWR